MANRALLVGINEYRDAPLLGCVNDVSDVHGLLKTKCNFADADVRVLLDRDATAANIRRHLQIWLLRDAAPNDRLVFHFSGHGTQLPGRDGTVHDVICPFDFDFTEATAISDVDFSTIFRSLPAGATFIWISDSCHSGDLARGHVNRKSTPRFLPPPPHIMAQIDALQIRGASKRSLDGVVDRLKGLLIAGCQSHETSADACFDNRYNGALTYYLLKLLSREEALTQNADAILQNVQGMLSKNGYAQHPQVRGLPELRQKPFLEFLAARTTSPPAMTVAVDPPVSDDAAASRVGDGRFWDDTFERAAPLGAAARGDPGWAKVRWAANDEDTVEYRHIANSPLKGAIFEFTPDDLELLLKANAFEPLRDRSKIIFALRGAELVVAGSAKADDKFHQVGRTVLNLRETRPDHQHFRCVIGVYDPTQRQLSAFIGSTVPCRQAVYGYANGGGASNMLPTGCYKMLVGTHNGRIGCLMEGEDFTVLRTTKDYVFDTKDAWDNTFPGDDLHPAFANGSAEFSSWGCQTIRGDCPAGTDRFSGEYKEFRQALGLRPGTADHGAKFSYVLLTGLEAAIANKTPDRAPDLLARLRHGSRGEQVRALQQKLNATVDGTFGSKLIKALADYQKKQLGWADGIYGPEMDRLLKFDILAPAPMAVAALESVATPALHLAALPMTGDTAGGASAEALQQVSNLQDTRTEDTPSVATDSGVALDGFVLRLRRLRSELRPGQGFPRTVSTYEAFLNREKLPGLEGMAFERQGPGDNGASGRKYYRRIAAGTYPFFTQDGTNYKTFGYQTSGDHPRPGVLVGNTGERVAILFHPGNLYLSSIGCINLSKPLNGVRDDMVYRESQGRVVAMIDAMKEKLGDQFPKRNGQRIPNAWLVIEGEPENARSETRQLVRNILQRQDRRSTIPPDALIGQEAYSLLGATMNGMVMPERVNAQLFGQLSNQVPDLRTVRAEFGSNLWSEWASGWQASTAIAEGSERDRVQGELQRIADALQQAGVDINDTGGLCTPLIDSARGNEWQAMRELHARGADLELRDRRGDTALTAAAFNGAHEAVAFLVAAGADPQAKIGEPGLARSATVEAQAFGEFEGCPPGSDPHECALQGKALHETNEKQLAAYDQIVRALDQVKIGSVCHVWDYSARRSKQDRDVWQVNGTQSAYYLSKLAIDADGAPRAYHPLDSNAPANGGKAFDWLANLSASDRHGIQGQNGAVGPAPGFVISATSVTDGRFPANDTRRYVDASSIPYVVLPKGKFPLPAGSKLKDGCVVCVVDTKTGGFTGAIFADVGRAVGEGSIRLAQRLGLTPFNPRRWPKVIGFDDGVDDRRFFYLVFPDSAVAAPWSVDEIQAQADALFESWGGKERLKAIVPGLPELKAPVTVFDEMPPAQPRDLDLNPHAEERALQRLRGLDVSKEQLLDELSREPSSVEPTAGVDRAPVPGKLAPDPHERSRDATEVHPDEFDGPGDLPPPGDTRAALPNVSWPASDKEAPCYAHLLPEDGDAQVGTSSFEFRVTDLQLLIAANAFKPEGHGDRIVFALRGARLQQKDSFENVDRIPLQEVRPDHRNFNCVIGIFNVRTGQLSAFKASTVPNMQHMTNYYRKVHNLPPFRDMGANMLPTGCYVFRVGTHGGNIYPALRLTDPEKLSEDGKVVVLRTSNDLVYKQDDLWDPCVPYDHIHCAYSYDSFSSAGCLTVCGPSTEGPWARFQSVLKTIPRNNRIDLVLLTGREASIAAALRADGRSGEVATVHKILGRLRPGSQGEPVRKLQERLGVAASGYFGWRTKDALAAQQRRADLACDGIYAPKADRLLAWDILSEPVAAPMVVAARSTRAASGNDPAKLTTEQIRRFAPKALQEYVDALADAGSTELSSFHISDTAMRLCHFMAQIGHECGGFTIKRESMNYTTTARLRAVWPSRFPDDASARPYVRNEEKLAEKVYGCRLGNVKKGDGFLYRGRGFVQITGRESYREMGRKLNLPLEDNPDLAIDPVVAVKIACRTWADKALAGERGMNELADANKLEALTYRINGGYTNIEDRRAEFRKAWTIWGQGAPPETVSEPEQIERGDRGEVVTRLTQCLQELGYPTGGSSPVFGSKTYSAVCRFQQEQGLNVSGVATPETWEALNRRLTQHSGGSSGGPPLARNFPGTQTHVPRPRELALVRGIRVFAIAMAFLAAAFGLVFLMSLSRPELLGSLSMWLPLVFAASVFIGAFLIGQWGTDIASSPSYELARTRAAAQQARQKTREAADVDEEEPEPVRSGTSSPESDT